jgi:hypothetical protein
MRMGLLLKISKQSREYVSARVTKEDLIFLERILETHAASFNSKMLVALLDAHVHAGQSPIPEIAIEMVVGDIVAK